MKSKVIIEMEHKLRQQRINQFPDGSPPSCRRFLLLSKTSLMDSAVNSPAKSVFDLAAGKMQRKRLKISLNNYLSHKSMLALLILFLLLQRSPSFYPPIKLLYSSSAQATQPSVALVNNVHG